MDAIFVLSFLPAMLFATILLSGGFTDWKPWVNSDWRFLIFMTIGVGYCGLYWIVRRSFWNSSSVVQKAEGKTDETEKVSGTEKWQVELKQDGDHDVFHN
jgi:hypothetical protein